MKSTAKRLSEVYCRPKTEEEWAMEGMFKPETPDHGTGVRGCLGPANWLVGSDADNYWKEIPVSQFQDLLNDSIVG